MKDDLTNKQKNELEKLTNDMVDDAKSMVDDYKKNPSEISGSVVEVNENSPFLEKQYKGDSWKKVIQASPEEALQFIKYQKELEESEESEGEQDNSEDLIPDWAQLLQKIQKEEELNKFFKK